MISRKMTQCGLNLNWPFTENYFLEDFNDFEVFFFLFVLYFVIGGFFSFCFGVFGGFFGGGGGGSLYFSLIFIFSGREWFY